MDNTHDTLTELRLGTPAWFTALAWLLPLGLLGQFSSAGLGLFLDPGLLGLHGALGMGLALPVLGLFAGAVLVRRLHGFGWWAAAALVLYLVQIALAAPGVPTLLALHPVNGALLLTASLVLLAKIERRRGRSLAFLQAR